MKAQIAFNKISKYRLAELVADKKNKPDKLYIGAFMNTYSKDDLLDILDNVPGALDYYLRKHEQLLKKIDKINRQKELQK